MDPRSEAAPRPLEGIRIVECGVWHAGPGANAILADLGAEVIKIESLSGEPERKQQAIGGIDFAMPGADDWSLLYEISNRSKKGISLDIAQPAGAAVLHRLIASADVFSTNLRAGTKRQLGIDHATLGEMNPRMIHLSVSGFGEEGPMAEVGGFDPMGQAISGMLFMSGSSDPVMLQSLILDQLCAIVASHAILTALVSRNRTGRGMEVHTSLYGSAIWLMYANVMMASVYRGDPPVRWGREVNTPLRNAYRCLDGGWLLGTNSPEDKYWPRFCVAVGREDLMVDHRFATDSARARNREALVAIVEGIFASQHRDALLALLSEHGLNFVPVQRVSEVLQDPQAIANRYVADVDHPLLGRVRMPGYPAHFSGHAAGFAGPAPRQGEHSDAILREMAYTDAEIARLRAEGVVC